MYIYHSHQIQETWTVGRAPASAGTSHEGTNKSNQKIQYPAAVRPLKHTHKHTDTHTYLGRDMLVPATWKLQLYLRCDCLRLRWMFPHLHRSQKVERGVRDSLFSQGTWSQNQCDSWSRFPGFDRHLLLHPLSANITTKISGVNEPLSFIMEWTNLLFYGLVVVNIRTHFVFRYPDMFQSGKIHIWFLVGLLEQEEERENAKERVCEILRRESKRERHSERERELLP